MEEKLRWFSEWRVLMVSNLRWFLSFGSTVEKMDKIDDFEDDVCDISCKGGAVLVKCVACVGGVLI